MDDIQQEIETYINNGEVDINFTQTSLKNERALLTCIFRNTEHYLDSEAFLAPEDFTKTNGLIYSIAQKMITEEGYDKIDVVTFISRVQEYNSKELKNKEEYIEALFENEVEEKNYKKYAVKIKQISLKKRLKKILLEAGESIKNDTSKVFDILSEVEGKIYDFTNDTTESQKIVKLGRDTDSLINELADNPKETLGFETGFKLYDEAVGGLFRRPSVNLIVGRAKSGKSFLALNLAEDQAQRGVPVLYLDTELTELDQKIRHCSKHSKIPIKELEKGVWRKDEEKKAIITSAMNEIQEMPLYYRSISGMPLDRVISTIRLFLNRIVKRRSDGEYNDCVIIYDYFKITTSKDLTDTKLQEWQVVGYMMQELRDYALKYNLPIVAFVQANRSGLKDFTEQAMSMSDRLTWLCTSMATLAKKTEDEINEYGKDLGYRKLYVNMCHHGEGLEIGDFIHLKNDFGTANIEECLLDSTVKNVAFERSAESEKKAYNVPQY